MTEQTADYYEFVKRRAAAVGVEAVVEAAAAVPAVSPPGIY